MSVVYLTTVGEVEEVLVAAADASIGRTFGVQTHRLPSLPEPDYAFDGQRKQFSSIPILRQLLEHPPADALRVFALTERDLFIPMLSFIFGQAQLSGRVAIVSAARLRQEFYSLPTDPPLLLTRVAKETVHELGHTFGLIHCLNVSCPMSLSTTIRQLDAKGGVFCSSCAIMLQEVLHQ